MFSSKHFLDDILATQIVDVAAQLQWDWAELVYRMPVKLWEHIYKMSALRQ